MDGRGWKWLFHRAIISEQSFADLLMSLSRSENSRDNLQRAVYFYSRKGSSSDSSIRTFRFPRICQFRGLERGMHDQQIAIAQPEAWESLPRAVMLWRSNSGLGVSAPFAKPCLF